MRYSKSKTQFMRRVRAKNEGATQRLIRALQDAMKVLNTKPKPRAEFTQAEVKLLQGLRKLITGRLLLNALAKQIALLPDDAPLNTILDPNKLDPKDL
jgi:hypothetical protein